MSRQSATKPEAKQPMTRTYLLIGVAGGIAIAIVGLASCSGGPSPEGDQHIVRNHHDFKEDPKFISPPTLGQPIYACSSNVTVKNFISGAKLEVFIDGAPAPNSSTIGQIPDPGLSF